MRQRHESSRTNERDRERGESKEKREGGAKQRETSGREKEGSSGLQLRGFSSRPGSRKEFMKGKSFPSTVRSPRGGAPEVSLMLRYFTRKLFKSNILPAVIKYKLHRGVVRALKYSPSARVRVTDISRTKLDNKSPFAGMKSFDSFANGAKTSPLRQYFYSGIYRKKKNNNYRSYFSATSLAQRDLR